MVDSPASTPDDADSVLPPGPRRSTYTPPPTPAPEEADPLADAIAAEYRAWVPVSRQPEPPAPSGGVSNPVTPPENPLAGLSLPEAAPFGPSIPPPPARASLTDDDLVAVLDPDRAGGNTGALIDLFEEQLTLRQKELRQLDEWEEQVRRSGVDSADEIVASVRSAYTGVIDVIAPEADAPSASSASPLSPGSPASSGSPASPAAPPLAPAPSEVVSADSAPTAPGAVVAPAIDPATLTPHELSSALADAPPPDTAQRTVATPPDDSVTDGAPVPPPLVEPHMPDEPRDPLAQASDWDALLAPVTEAPSASPEPPAPFTLTPTSPAAAAEEAPTVVPPVEAAAPFEPAPDVEASPEPASPDASDPPPATAAPLYEAPAPAPAPTPAPAPPASAAHPPLPTADEAPARGPRAFALEQSALEPTPAALRAGRAVRLFWLWFAVNASVVTVALGALLIADGASLRQAVLAALGGVALSSFLLGVITRTGRWSGQPTIVVARATFGTVGNAIPAVLAVLVRVVWASALLFVLGIGVAEVLVEAQLDGGLGKPVIAAIVAAIGFVLAATTALLGFGLIARLGAVIAPLAGVLVVGLIVLTAPRVDLGAALGIPDGSWALLVGGSVLILSAIGLAWVSSGGDLVRYQAAGSSGTAAALWTGIGVALPAFLLVVWGAVLAASSPLLLEGLVTNPVDTLARLLPLWYPVPLALAVGLSLIAGAAFSLYSGGFAVLTLGAPAPRWLGVLIAAVVSAVVLVGLLFAGGGVDGLLRDVLIVLAVPVAAWAGILGTETLLRRRRVHAPSLLQPGGVYPSVRWTPLVGFFVASGLGLGFIDTASPALGWTGYLWPLLPLPADSAWLASDAGVVLALLVGALVAVASVPGLRRLHDAEASAAA